METAWAVAVDRPLASRTLAGCAGDAALPDEPERGGGGEGRTVVDGDGPLLVQPVENGGLLWPYTSKSESLELDDTFLVTAGALGAAAPRDFELIGVVGVPRASILHRVLLVLALGLIGAAGALSARGGGRVDELLVYGVSGRVAGLLVTLSTCSERRSWGSRTPQDDRRGRAVWLNTGLFTPAGSCSRSR